MLIMPKKLILVSIAMPNDSDLEIMNESAKTLESIGIGYELRVVSIHRSPERMIEYAKTARDRGIQVVIAAARGAGHLPGGIAAFTTLPVIAVPLKSPFLDGFDSILSMVQMPLGVPVATVSINGGRNAAILACQIISLHDEKCRLGLDKLKRQLIMEVEEQAKNVKRHQ
jgi:5-(carboxyamino)imidazole ribonucleotide mutase